MINTVSEKLSTFFRKYLPSAFIFAIFLTFVTILAGTSLTDESFLGIVKIWGDSFWSLNRFAMEMTIILVTGSALALSTPIKKFLDKILIKIQTQSRAVLLVFSLSSLSCLFNWGFGLIFASIFVLKLLSRKSYNPGLLLASAYSGFLFWHGGLSGSIPLKLTNPSELVREIIETSSISLSQTIFAQLNIVLLLANFITVFVILYFLSRVNYVGTEYSAPDDIPHISISADHFSDKIENSKILLIVLCVFGLIYFTLNLTDKESLDLSSVSWAFLFLGLLFSGSIKNYKAHFIDSVKNCSGVILQFPFYAGIMGIIAESGLGTIISHYVLNFSNHNNFLFLTYLSAGLLNFFVPSGGGQWAIQGPIILPVAKEYGISLANSSMAIAWGDAWTNMIQPFWALPILGMTGIKLSELIKYTFIVFICSGVVSSVIFVIMNS